MRVRVSSPVASRLAAAAILTGLAVPCASHAQGAAQAEPAAIDPSAPLPPLPDLGIPWPTADQPMAAPDAGLAPDPAAGAAPADAAGFITDPDRAIAYRVAVDGLEELGLEGEFRAASALRAHRSADGLAQLELRARADVALIERLLRSVGYYAATASFGASPVATCTSLLRQRRGSWLYLFSFDKEAY